MYVAEFVKCTIGLCVSDVAKLSLSAVSWPGLVDVAELNLLEKAELSSSIICYI